MSSNRTAKKRATNWAAIGIVAMFVLIAGIAVSCEVSLWGECRSDHSWLYCMRVLGDR